MSRLISNKSAFFLTHPLGVERMLMRKAPLLPGGKGFYFNGLEPGRGKAGGPDMVSEALKMWKNRKCTSIDSNTNGHLSCLWL